MLTTGHLIPICDEAPKGEQTDQCHNTCNSLCKWESVAPCSSSAVCHIHCQTKGRFCALWSFEWIPLEVPPISILLDADTGADVAAPLASRVSPLTGQRDCSSRGQQEEVQGFSHHTLCIYPWASHWALVISHYPASHRDHPFGVFDGILIRPYVFFLIPYWQTHLTVAAW